MRGTGLCWEGGGLGGMAGQPSPALGQQMHCRGYRFLSPSLEIRESVCGNVYKSGSADHMPAACALFRG